MAAESELNVRVTGRDELSPTLSQLESRVIRWVGAISAAVAAIRITAAPLVATAEFERELANVQKTTNFTTSELKTLGDELQRLSTRIDVSTIDLTKIAAAAGQQGLGRFGVEGVVQFTESVSRMASVLDITAEDAATNIGKIANIFKIPLQDIEQAVSTFNQVSNNSTAEGEELLDVVRRIGDAAGVLRGPNGLQQSVALAATGLDFGVNPEVVGTSFTKIFSSLREEAGQFAALLKTDTESWLQLVEKDGIEAFKAVLAAMRELNPQAQQEFIVKTLGGGRIGALVNKLLQDTQNSVLERNFAQALEGKQGLSAIREQETVINTLVAQTQAALNSLFGLATEVGEQALTPLTQYVAQLNQAFQSEGLQSFLSAVVGSVLDLVGALADAVKFLGSLNVNWENFIRVAQVFLGLKLAQYFGGVLTRNVENLANSFNTLKNGADAAVASSRAIGSATQAAAAAQASANASSAGAIASRAFGYDELYKKVQAYVAAKKAEAAAEREVQVAAAAATKAQNAAAVAQGRGNAGNSQLNAAAQAAQQQRAVLTRAEQQAAAQQLAVQNSLNASLTRAAQRDAAIRLQIEQAYQDRLRAIRETGTTRGLTALKREYANQHAQADAAHARALRSTQAYYDRQAAIAAAGSARIVEVERLALMQRLSALDGAMANQASRGANSAAAAAAAVAANAALAQSQTRLTAMTAAANAAQAAWASLGVVLRTVTTVIGALVRVASGLFFWGTLAYTILDLTVGTEKLGKAFQSVTDWLGLTSNAMRQKAIEDERERKAIEEKTKALDDLIEKYREYIDASSGQLDTRETDRLFTIARTSEDESTRQQAIAQLADFAQVLAAEQQRLLASVDASPQLIAQAQADIKKYQDEVARLLRQQEIPQIDYAANGQSMFVEVDNSQQIENLNRKIKETEDRIRSLGASSEAFRSRIDGLAQSADVLNAEFAKMFTPQTLAYANEALVNYADQRIELERLKRAMEDLNQAAKTGNPESIAAAAEATRQYELQRSKVAELRAAMEAYVAAEKEREKAQKVVSPTVLASWEQFLILIRAIPEDVKRAVSAANDAASIGLAVNGSNANPNIPTPTTGENDRPPRTTNGESQARRLERARLQLARAQIQAENALYEEQSKQELERETVQYEQGLKRIRDYYKERQNIQREAIQFDITDARRELEEINVSIASARERGQKAERLGYEASAARVLGQIRVLEERKKAVDADTKEEERRALEAFNDRILEETNRLRDDGIIPADSGVIFQGTLDEMLSSYRLFLTQLRTEGNGALADSITRGFNVRALQASLAPIQRDLERSMQSFSRYQSRLQIAQETGVLTTNQFLASYDQAIDGQIGKLREFIARQEQILEQNAALADTPGYQALADQIDDARLALEGLRAEQNRVANDFNRQTTDSLADLLGNLRLTTDSIQDAIWNFLGSIVQNIQTTLGRSIAESITQSLGQTGSGGIGGWIQGLMQGPDSLAASGLAQRGASFANPLYVQEVSPGELGKAVSDPLGDFIKDKGFAAAGGIDESGALGDSSKQDGFLTKLGTTVGSVFGNLSSTLGTLFSGLMTTLSSLFTSLIAAMSGGGGGGFASAIGAFFGAAHTGGIAGQTSMRRWAPFSAFNNAVRAHNGGIAGLEPNEVPMILEEGETIRTKQQEAALQQQLSAASSAGAANGGAKGVRVVLVDDRTKVPEAMNSPEGDQVFVQQARRNISTLKSLLR